MNLTLEIWPWFKVMTQPLIIDNVYIIQIQHDSKEFVALTPILGMYVLWPWVLNLAIWSWFKVMAVMAQPWVMDINCVKYYPDPTWQ